MSALYYIWMSVYAKQWLTVAYWQCQYNSMENERQSANTEIIAIWNDKLSLFSSTI